MMEPNCSSKPHGTHQPSIRSFFQPRTPQYTTPPGSSSLLPTTAISRLPVSTPLPPTASFTPRPKLASQPSQPSNCNTSKLPQQAAICPFERHHIQPLRRINSLLLEISYPDSFYSAIHSITPPSLFSRAILWTDPEPKVIGGIVCRLDPSLSPFSTQANLIPIQGSYDIYVQSLVLLSPYREKGLAAEALQSVIRAAAEQREFVVRELYAHVWTRNEDGLSWYTARGFVRDEDIVHGYYRRLKPDTAWIMRRRLVPSDHLQAHAQPQQPDILQVPAGEEKRPLELPHTKSFQDRRPEREWNDLPEDVLKTNLLLRPGSGDVSAASSRSSSRSGVDGKKKKRQYPAAAFGS